MNERDLLARQFERHRPRLRAVAWRMLGSGQDAEDAVQEAWLRLSRSDVGHIVDLGPWLTTVVGRVCLDRLRSRRSRAEQAFDEPGGADVPDPGPDPEWQAELSDSVGMALAVVLDTLEPAERLAFVLHDVFAVPFAEIAPLVQRSPAATKMLASRARRRLAGADAITGPDAARRRTIVRAFLSASRDGCFDALLALLDPGVRFRADAVAVRSGAPAGASGAQAVARLFSGRARGARLVLIDGDPGSVWMHRGRVEGAFTFAFAGDRIAAIDLVADPWRLGALSLTFISRRDSGIPCDEDR